MNCIHDRKLFFMENNDKEQPSGPNKSEGLGLRTGMPAEKLDQEMTEKYTAGEDEPAENLPLKHPNRNTEKGDAGIRGKNLLVLMKSHRYKSEYNGKRGSPVFP